MTDAVAISLITGIVSIITGIIVSVTKYSQDKLHKQINSRMSEFMALLEKASKAEGKIEGKAEGKAEEKAKHE